MNQLHFGDNLDVLIKYVKDESVDLIYLDPPFNSNAIYNAFFKEGDGVPSEAQAEAFKDTWGWGPAAAEAYEDLLRVGGDLAVLMRALRTWLTDKGLMAYLAMMAIRLVELHRVLKDTGSLYLHCDPTASHYLKLILDAVFGAENFQAEIVWRRTNSRSTSGKWPRLHDIIFHYSRTPRATFHSQTAPGELTKVPHTLITGPDGLKYNTYELTGAGRTKEGESGRPWRGFDPDKMGRHWGYSHAQLEEWAAGGLIHFPAKNGFPRRRAEDPFDPLNRMVTVGDVWADIDRLNQTAKERLGYPTQKPRALLERIISASSNPGDVVLDPFCGCGTAVDAAEKLGRQWIGIDITHYAVTLIETRVRKNHPTAEFTISGRPTDLAGARELAARDKYQFQWWAAWKLGAQTYESKKGGDRGIDANIFFANGPYGHGRIIVSVKGGEHLNPAMVNELNGVVQRESAEMGILITLAEPTRGMIASAAGAGFVEKSAHGRLPRIQIVTVQDMLDGRLPKMPPLPVPSDAPRVRARKRDRDQLELMLPFSGASGLRTEDGAMIDPDFVRFGSSR